MAALAVVFLFPGEVGRVVGVAELVVLGLVDPADRDLQAAEAADAVAIQILPEPVVEELVVPELVRRDRAADLLEHRLVGRLRDGRVEAAGPGLDDAARDQLPGARAAHRLRRVQRQPESVEEVLKGALEVELGIDELGPFGQRDPVLHLFLAPGPDHVLERRVVGKDVAEVFGVVGAVMLDQRGGLHELDQLGIHLVPVEFLPGDIVQCPSGLHASHTTTDVIDPSLLLRMPAQAHVCTGIRACCKPFAHAADRCGPRRPAVYR